MSTVFGGKKESSDAHNVNNGMLTQALSPVVGAAGQGTNAMTSLLGLNGSDAQNAGFQNYADSAGAKFTLDQGSQAITDNNAANGMLRSGATLKALTRFGQGNAQQYVQDYMKNLLGLSTVGTQAAGVLSDSGKTETKSGSEKPGMGKFLGQIAVAAAASDRRLKKDIKKISEMAGIPVYSWKYLNSDKTFTGVLAQDLLEIPELASAVSTGNDGFYRVDYSRLGFIPEDFIEMRKAGETAARGY